MFATYEFNTLLGKNYIDAKKKLISFKTYKITIVTSTRYPVRIEKSEKWYEIVIKRKAKKYGKLSHSMHEKILNSNSKTYMEME